MLNRFYENMGIYSSVRSATERDALAQMTEWTYSFGDAVQEGGLKHAFTTRDALTRATRDFEARTDVRRDRGSRTGTSSREPSSCRR